jgi:hypothetical protein
MSEKKTISINPDFFKVQSKQTRKKRPQLDMEGGDGEIPKLRIKTERPKTNRTTKNQILKYIRQQQENRYKHLMERSLGAETRTPSSVPANEIPAHKSDVAEFQSDFQQSLDYLNLLAEKNRQSLAAQPISQTMSPIPAHPFHNQTLKRHSPLVSSPVLPGINYTPLPNVVSTLAVPATSNALSLKPTAHSPQYGCLKNGSLPTYRMWKQQTQKNYPMGAFGAPVPPTQTPTGEPVSVNTLPTTQPTTTVGQVPSEWQEQQEKWNKIMKKFHSPDWLKRKQEIREHQKIKEREKEIQSKPKFVRRKMRKTARRTFRLGRSKYYPRVAVLVSNRTIRKQIADECQKLKQTPIEEVRKTLIKKGFIKVGSIAPNDVLRKMYESVSTICGDIQNHNSDNLVYNYFHDK